MALAIYKGIWLKRLIKELGIITSETMKVFCDNQSAISTAKNPVHYNRTKHMEIDRHFIKEKIENENVSLLQTPTSQQIADIHTKALLRKNFEDLSS